MIALSDLKGAGGGKTGSGEQNRKVTCLKSCGWFVAELGSKFSDLVYDQ